MDLGKKISFKNNTFHFRIQDKNKDFSKQYVSFYHLHASKLQAKGVLMVEGTRLKMETGQEEFGSHPALLPDSPNPLFHWANLSS